MVGLGLAVGFGVLGWAYVNRPATHKHYFDPAQLNQQMSDLPEIPDTQAMCDAVGGVWGRIGTSSKDQCNIKTSDGGYGCIDSKACEGLCIAKLSPEQLVQLKQSDKPIQTRGECAVWRIVVGCQPVVVEGEVAGMFCID